MGRNTAKSTILYKIIATSTNCTPHERLFGFQRRPGSMNSQILPSWLINPGPVLLRNFEKVNKNDVLVRRVELLEANPNYAIIKDAKGTTKAVSTKDLAPVPEKITKQMMVPNDNQNAETNKESINDNEYESLVEDAKNKISKVTLPRLSLPEEFAGPSRKEENSTDVQTIGEQDDDTATTTRSGRKSRMPAR